MRWGLLNGAVEVRVYQIKYSRYRMMHPWCLSSEDNYVELVSFPSVVCLAPKCSKEMIFLFGFKGKRYLEAADELHILEYLVQYFDFTHYTTNSGTPYHYEKMVSSSYHSSNLRNLLMYAPKRHD